MKFTPKYLVGLLAIITLTPITNPVSCRAIGLDDQTQANQITHLICDLNGVFFDTSHGGMAQEVGIGYCMLYLLTFHNPGNIKKIAFNFLDAISGPQVPQDENGPILADGLPMPELMRQWKSGEHTGAEILAQVNSALASGDHNSYFSSSIEKQLVTNIINAVLNPRILARHTHPIQAGVKILEECAKNSNLELIVLSNYAQDAFENLSHKRESRKVFKHFKPENIVLSGNVGAMKPSRKIFDYVIEKYSLDPATCVFIDDHKNNTDAAEKAGFKTILVENGNFTAVRKKLVELGVLDK